MGKPATVWNVEGYRRIKVMMKVSAETRGEAIRKALAGDYFDVDTEPDCDIQKSEWTAHPALPRRLSDGSPHQ
jgi:hypothetical protein